MYLSCGTYFDIAFMVGQLSGYNSDPQASHLHITKQVLYYLKRIIMLGIKWSKGPAGHLLGEKYGDPGMVGYIDNSYASDLEDKNSIIRYCFFLVGAIVTWCNKRQPIVLKSTSKAKYMAMS